jgi:hypothetical protein
MDSNSMNTFAGSVHHKIKNKFKEARTTTDAVEELGDLVLVTLIIKYKMSINLVCQHGGPIPYCKTCSGNKVNAQQQNEDNKSSLLEVSKNERQIGVYFYAQ